MWQQWALSFSSLSTLWAMMGSPMGIENPRIKSEHQMDNYEHFERILKEKTIKTPQFSNIEVMGA